MAVNSSTLLKAFDYESGLYDDFRKKVETLITELLSEKGLRTHSIASRLKSRDSFEKKVSSSEASYDLLNDVTDIVGVRIISYFPDEVSEIAAVLAEEFELDLVNSVDKGAALDPDRFGYISLHYIAKVHSKRLEMTEYKRFASCKFEVQMRSILQHTWAEIEHDLGYKTTGAIPNSVRRRFSRLAGLLELADDEFARIRDDLAIYQKQLDKDIKSAPETVSIDADSITSYIKSNPEVIKYNAEIVSLADIPISEAYWSGLADGLKRVGLTTISQVDDELTRLGKIAVKMVTIRAKKSKMAAIPPTQLLHVVCVIKCLETGGNSLKDYIDYAFGTSTEESKKNVMEFLPADYEAAISGAETEIA